MSALGPSDSELADLDRELKKRGFWRNQFEFAGSAAEAPAGQRNYTRGTISVRRDRTGPFLEYPASSWVMDFIADLDAGKVA